MRSEDRVAVLLCTYNGEKYLAEQLDSLIGQTYENFVCYVHDDGSKDRTMQILEEYKQKMQDRLVITQYQNDRHSASYNFCSLTKYADEKLDEQYIMFCDQDDVWLPEKIEKAVDAVKSAEADGEPALSYCDQKIVNERLEVMFNSNDEIIRRTEADKSFKRIVFRNIACGCCICINRPLLRLVCEGMDIDDVVMHDWWVMLVAEAAGNVVYVPESLMLYRQHGNNSLGADNNNYLRKAQKYMKDFGGSMKNRSEQTQKCIRQVYALRKIIKSCKYKAEIKNFCRAMKKGKVYRMNFIRREGYLSPNNYITLLFV